MNETKYSQFKDRSNLGKPSRLRWLFPFLLISFNILISASLLLLRSTGIFPNPQSFWPLVTLGGLLSCFSSGALLLIRALRLMNLTVGQQNCLTLVIVIPVVAGMLALVPLAAFSLTGAIFLSLAYFMGFAGVMELINRERNQYRATEFPGDDTQTKTDFPTSKKMNPVAERSPDEVQKLDDIENEVTAATPDKSEENNEALFEALLGQKASTQKMVENDSGEESRSQWMNRTTDSEGVETVEGGTLVRFSANQKVSIVHIGLFPPLEGKISVSCDFESGTPVRFRLLEVRGYGVSVEVKRTRELEMEFETNLKYTISDHQFNEDVA